MRPLVVVLIVLLGVGCQQEYYKITDVPSGRSFYTKAWLPGLYGRYNAIHFKDLATGDDIVLQSSRAHRVSADEALRATGIGGSTTRPTP